MQATIDKKQLNDLIDNLKDMGDLVADAVFDEAQATALEIETDAKQRCPVDTGRLRSSIKAIYDRKTFTAGVFTDVEYAPDVEFGSDKEWVGTFKASKSGKKTLEDGTKISWKKGKKYNVTHKRKIAQPFLYPAYFAGIGRLMRNLENVMKNVKGDK